MQAKSKGFSKNGWMRINPMIRRGGMTTTMTMSWTRIQRKMTKRIWTRCKRNRRMTMQVFPRLGPPAIHHNRQVSAAPSHPLPHNWKNILGTTQMKKKKVTQVLSWGVAAKPKKHPNACPNAPAPAH